jgi:outer membrane receptor protein involved in Fe transport
MRRGGWAVAYLCLSGVPSPVLAQDQVETYGLEFFTAARPATAMDMINRLPGFSFDGGDGSRGFSGNSGNVLIDGKRPTSKTDGLSEVLSRIVSGDVERIDVIHGSTAGIDMQGKSVMANLVRKETPSTNIVALANETFFVTGRAIPGAALQYSHTEGERSYDLSVRRDPKYNDDMGEARITNIDPTGMAAATEETRRGSGGNLGLNGAIKTPLAGGDFGANATVNQSEFSSGALYDYAAGPQNYASTSRNQNGEVGASYELPLGKTVLGVELLQRLGHSVSTQLLDDSGADERFSSLRDTGESITRFTLRQPLSPSVALEGGGEVAYNFLRGRSLYTQGGTVQVLPSSDVNVSERRGEAFIQASWQLDKSLMLDAGVRAEYSTISESGDAALTRSFFYPKPRAVLTWNMDDHSLVRLRVEHRLGQLNFGDFISSANLTQGNVTAGNPNLQPDQRWQYELAYEFHFWDQGALTVGLVHQDIDNLLDLKPLSDATSQLFDVRGNIGSGRSDTLSVRATLPTGRLLDLLAGARLNIAGDWRDSAVTDPLTGVRRRFAYEEATSYSVNFTQDLEALRSTWAVYYYNGYKEIGSRLAENDVFLGNPQVNLAWAYQPSAKLNFNFQITNILISSHTRISDYFSGPRNISPLLNRELEIGYSRPRVYFNIRKTSN